MHILLYDIGTASMVFISVLPFYLAKILFYMESWFCQKKIYSFCLPLLEIDFWSKIILQAEKNVFIVFYSGERAKSKILKICEAFGANRYPFSEELGRQAQMMTEVCIIFWYMSDSAISLQSHSHMFLCIFFICTTFRLFSGHELQMIIIWSCSQLFEIITNS